MGEGERGRLREGAPPLLPISFRCLRLWREDGVLWPKHACGRRPSRALVNAEG